jgi:dienelactone hydrolase
MADLIETELRLPGDPVHGTLVRGASRHSDVGVVVISGSGGGDLISTAFARALAAEGFPSLGVGYFKVPGRADELRDVELEYFLGAIGAMRSAGTTHDVVVIGSSRGSEAALLLAAHAPGLVQGVVGLVPADAAFGSFPPGGAAWTLDGVPVPLGPIAVERIDAPLMVVAAGRDEIWPSSSMARSIVVRRHDHGAECTHLDYPDATHALSFLVPNDTGSSPDDAARRAAWPHLLDFLRRCAP